MNSASPVSNSPEPRSLEPLLKYPGNCKKHCGDRACDPRYHPNGFYGTKCDLEIERFEAGITELWAHINAATYRFLKLVGEYDRNEGWARHGLVNCAHWLNWQCGISPQAAREKVRIARALEQLPKISAAFERGQVSYSKVRAMTRVATPANEADLLNIARNGTACQLERVVYQYRRVKRREEAERTLVQHNDRFLYLGEHEDGSLTIEAKLPAEVGAVVRKALEEAVEAFDRAEAAERANAQSPNEKPAGASAEAGRHGSPTVRDFAAGADEHDAREGEPHEGDAHEGEAKAEKLSPSMKYADALGALASVYLSERTAKSPSLADRYQVVVHIDQRLLSDGAKSVDAVTSTEPATSKDPATSRKTAASMNFADSRASCEYDDGRPLAIDTARRLGCEASIVGLVEGKDAEPLNIGRKTRAISPALRRAIKARDGACRFPGCTHTRFTDVHHVIHWADGGETRPGNLVTACSFHHRLIHEGGFGVRATADGSFEFTRPDGSLIPEAGPRFRGSAGAASCSRGSALESRSRGSAAVRSRSRASAADASDAPSRGSPPDELPLIALNRAHGLAIDGRTILSRWLGERLDYSCAIESLMYFDSVKPR